VKSILNTIGALALISLSSSAVLAAETKNKLTIQIWFEKLSPWTGDLASYNVEEFAKAKGLELVFVRNKSVAATALDLVQRKVDMSYDATSVAQWNDPNTSLDGTPMIIGTTNMRSGYFIGGLLAKTRAGDVIEPKITDLLGGKVLGPRCGWIGDRTAGKRIERGGQTPSLPMEMPIRAINETIERGDLPAETRVGCDDNLSIKGDVVHFVSEPGQSVRRRSLTCAATKYFTALPIEYIGAPCAGGKSEIAVYLPAEQMPKVPFAMGVVLAERMEDPVFRNKVERYAEAMRESAADLIENPEKAKALIAKLAETYNQGSFSRAVERHGVNWLYEQGLKVWTSKCPTVDDFALFEEIMDLKGKVKYHFACQQQ